MACLKTYAAAKNEQLDALTGLRGFAALWVVSLHFMEVTTLLLPASASINWLMGAGANAVPLFFVLSGFILLHTYRDRFEIFSWREYFRFLGLRLARIYPAYLAALMAMVMLVAASSLTGVPYNHDAYPLRWLLPEALMLHNWVLMPPNFFGWNYPDWSVSAEWFAYLFIFPPAVWLLKSLAGQRKIIIAALALALFALEPAIRTEWKLSMVSLLFLAGALLWEFRRRTLESQHRLPAARTCVFLGDISYSVYHVHGIVQRLLKIILPAQNFAAYPLPARAGIVLAEFAAVLLAALLLYF